MTASEMGLMEGSPPPAGKVVTVANWEGPPWNRWAYQHVSEVIPTARVWRGRGGVEPLPRDLRELEKVAFDTMVGGSETVGHLLRRTYTDGFLVLHQGVVVSEQYFNGMHRHTRHLLQSVSKSITGTVAGALWDRGLLDPDARLDEYVPEVCGTSFEGASVRHLLDMTAGTRFSEDYDDPESDVRLYEGAAGWRPLAPDDERLNLFTYALALPNVRRHGELFDYRSILTDVLGIVLERAAGRRYADLLSEMIWAPIGPEEDAEITVDRVGNPMTDGGISVTLRDLGRFGLMVAQYGTVGGRQILPAAWVEDTRYGDTESRRTFERSDSVSRYPGGHYRNQWWVPSPCGGVLLGSGIYGQSLYCVR